MISGPQVDRAEGGIPWDELSGSARDTLADLAYLFLERGTYSVRIEIHEGGQRDFRVETSPQAFRRAREPKAG